MIFFDAQVSVERIIKLKQTVRLNSALGIRFGVLERESCLLVLNSVTSTLQWIRQPKPRDVVHDVCVFVCKCVLGSSRASQPLNIRLCLF
jgi:hypothetical protein